MTRKDKNALLTRVTREYQRALAEARSLTEAGNGFATRAEMLKAISALYIPTIYSLRRQLA